MSMCESCIHSKHNNGGTWCKYSRIKNDPPGDCDRSYNRYESIYTIEPTVVLGSRYYTPQMNDEQITLAPIVLAIPGEEE